MHIHGPDLLQGPVSRHRSWWNSPEFDSMVYDTPEKFEAALDRLLDRLEEKS